LKHGSAFIISTNTSSQTAWPRRQRQYNLSKHWELLTQWQCVMSQMIWTFSNTTVRISNLTNKPYNSMSPVQCELQIKTAQHINVIWVSPVQCVL
jgi:hypothetical protein